MPPLTTGSGTSSIRHGGTYCPIATAERTIEREYDEIDAERTAFGQFDRRIAADDGPSVARAGSVPAPRTLQVDTRSRAVKKLRTAFRETVMNVDHYEETYGESLDEHLAAELPPDVTTILRREQCALDTETTKTVLRSAVRRAIARRETYLDALDECRTAIATLLDEDDRVPVPEPSRRAFERRLDEIAARRQETVHVRTPASRMDGHDFC